MEYEKINNSLDWVKKLPQNLLQTLLDFLSPIEWDNLAEAFEGSCQKNSKLATLSGTRLFISTYINKTQRSMYMSFYGERPFQEMQRAHCALIESRFPHIFSKHNRAFKNIFSQLKEELRMVDSREEIKQQLELTLCDPEMPFPKMRKEGIGMFCNSSFQFFLVDRRYGQQEPYLPECFQDLKNFVDAMRETRTQSQLNGITEDKDKLKILHRVRFAPDTIDQSNYHQLLIKGDVVNNSVVLLFALTAGLARAMDIYVQQFRDPLALLVQLLLRYGVFRNFVLSIEEKCSFFFDAYEKSAEQILGSDQNEPRFCFWRPAMTIWYRTMRKHHETAQQTFIYLLTRLRTDNLLNGFEDLQGQIPSTAASIQNKLSLREFELGLRDAVYHPLTQNLGLQRYFDSNRELYHQLCRDYLEYIMDLSVNQLTVHWCGHSEHSLELPYLDFQDSFMEYTENYLCYLKHSILKFDTLSERFALRQILDREMSFLALGFVKPTTLKKVAQHSNGLLQVCLEKQCQQLTSTNNSQTYSFEEAPSPLPKLQFTTCEQDKMLNYYNKEYTPKTMASKSMFPLHQNLNSSQRLMFSISATAEAKLMVKSLDMLSKSIKMKNMMPALQKIDSVEKSAEDLAEYFSNNETEEMELTEGDLLVFGKVASFSERQIQIGEIQQCQEIVFGDRQAKIQETKSKQIIDLFPARLSRDEGKTLEQELERDQESI